MVLEKYIRYFSRKWNLPADQIRREIEEQDRFVCEVFDTEPERESDPEVVKRIMAGYVRRSDAASVPYVKGRYLFESALIAAMYIYAHDDDWTSGVLPDFYEEAMEHADTALMTFGEFDELLVSNMLKLYTLKDVQEIIDCMKEVRRYVHWAKKHSTYYISQYRQSELYRRYEIVCMQAGVKLSFDNSIKATERIRLVKHLTKIKNNELLMRVYFILYRLYQRHEESEGYAIYNFSTGNTYFEEYLEKAYTIMSMSYKLESLNFNSYSHRTWLRIAVDYASIMCLDNQGLIPYNPIEAERILKFASQVDIEDISCIAQDTLQKYFNE